MTTSLRPVSMTAMSHVASVPRSIEFYRHLGFAVRNTVTPDGATDPVWAWLSSQRADLMVALASAPVVAAQQAVLFYIYCDDVDAYRDQLVALGIACGAIGYPFYSPRGEFRVHDPDGYVLMVSHT